MSSCRKDLLNQPVGLELTGSARDQGLEDRDCWEREQESHEAEEDAAAEDPDQNHERMNPGLAAQDERFEDEILEKLDHGDTGDHPQDDIVRADHRQQRVNRVREE